MCSAVSWEACYYKPALSVTLPPSHTLTQALMQTNAWVETARKRNVQLSCFTLNIPGRNCSRWDERRGVIKPDAAEPVTCGMWMGLSESVHAGREGGRGWVCDTVEGGGGDKSETRKKTQRASEAEWKKKKQEPKWECSMSSWGLKLLPLSDRLLSVCDACPNACDVSPVTVTWHWPAQSCDVSVTFWHLHLYQQTSL